MKHFINFNKVFFKDIHIYLQSKIFKNNFKKYFSKLDHSKFRFEVQSSSKVGSFSEFSPSNFNRSKLCRSKFSRRIGGMSVRLYRCTCVQVYKFTGVCRCTIHVYLISGSWWQSSQISPHFSTRLSSSSHVAFSTWNAPVDVTIFIYTAAVLLYYRNICGTQNILTTAVHGINYLVCSLPGILIKQQPVSSIGLGHCLV